MKLFKILSFALLLCLVLSIFSGCSVIEDAFIKGMENAEQAIEEQERIRAEYFVKVADDWNSSICCYKEARTDVMYMVIDSGNLNGRGCALSVMLHPDGTPLLYSEWAEMEVLPVGETNP